MRYSSVIASVHSGMVKACLAVMGSGRIKGGVVIARKKSGKSLGLKILLKDQVCIACIRGCERGWGDATVVGDEAITLIPRAIALSCWMALEDGLEVATASEIELVCR